MWQRVWNAIMDNFELRTYEQPSMDEYLYDDQSEEEEENQEENATMNKRQRKFLRKQNQYSDVI